MLETNELTEKLRTLLHPRAALIAYAREDNSHYVYDNSYFIEVRDIDESGIMGRRPSGDGGVHERAGTGLFRKAQRHTVWKDTVQPVVVRPA